MTGYGRGAAEREGRRAVVEMRSVNHRFLDVKVRGQSVSPDVEEAVKKRVKGACERGVVNVSIRIERQASATAMKIDLDAARRAHEALSDLARELPLRRGERGSDSGITLSLLSQQPGVLVASDPADDPEDQALTSECVQEAVESALANLVAMRATEGEALAGELAVRLDNLRALADVIAEHAENAPEHLQERLHTRLERLLQTRGNELDADRLAHEVAVLADRVDITEELVRLRGHIEHMRGLMDESRAQGSAVGRRLEFLGQEMGREVNTIGAKSQSAEIARAVVDAKAELEKIREQVQNLE